MISYSKYPFLRLLIAFVLGIVTFEFVSYSFSWYVQLLVLLPFFLFPLLAPKKIRLHHRKAIYIGIALQCFFFVFGYGNAQFHSQPVQVPDLAEAEGVICHITQAPVKKTRSYKSEAYIEAAYIHQAWIPVQKKMIVYSPPDDAAPWAYDDVVYIRSAINRPQPPANPHQFNYKRYLEKKGIYYQSYVKDEDIKIMGKDHQLTIDDFAENSVQYTRRVFHTLVPDSGLGAIATALLVGFQEELDPDTKTSFTRVGAMHILAVSGLHVGIIFLLLSKMLFMLDRHLYTRIIKAIILFIFLWGYAVIAGFSPSIVRASLMFSIMIPMLSFHLQGNAYNNIASSAFLLLLWQPGYLFDVGFQLSYVAVFGIIYLYPYLKNWVKSRYWLVTQAWQLTAVSIAATIFTCPIVLYNFGQFPLSFLISNLVAVPVSTFIIYTGLAALIFFRVHFLAVCLGKVLYLSLRFLKWSIEWIESLPYSYADHLLINRWQAFILYGMIISTLLYFQFRKVRYIKISLCMVCLLMLSLIARKYSVLHHQELYIYNLNKTSYIEYADGRTAVNIFHQPLSELDYGLFIRTNHQHAGIFYTDSVHKQMHVFSPGWQVRNTRFFMIEKHMPVSDRVLETDYLVISKLRYLDVDLLQQQFRFKKLILLNNHPVKKIRKFEALLTEAGIPFHSLYTDGYLSIRY